MRVVEVTEYGPPEVLHVAERPDPEPAEGEVVVAIHATGVNPTDLSTRDGSRRKRMPDLEPPFVPGWDLAGELAETGERVVGMIPFVQIGGRVGAYAERAAVDPAWLAPLPDGVPFEEAATLPLNSLTARQSLDLLGLVEGDTLLVTGASGGVGGFAVQMAVADGVRVIGVAGTGDEDWVAELGAHEVLPRDADLGAIGPVDGVLDAVPVGPDRSTRALRDGGTAVFTRSPGTGDPDRGLHFETILVEPDAGALTRFAEELADGRLRTRVARVLPLEEAAEGHRLTEAGGLHGKVVLRIRPEGEQ